MWRGKGAPGVPRKIRPVTVPRRVADQDCLTTTARIVNIAASKKRRSSEWVNDMSVTLET